MVSCPSMSSRARARKPEAIERAEQIFKLIDTDDDLKVSLKEFTNKPPEARFKQIDRNDDGKITFDEFKGKARDGRGNRRKPSSGSKGSTRTGDKELTLAEYKASQEKQQPKKSARKNSNRNSYSPPRRSEAGCWFSPKGCRSRHAAPKC